MDIAINILSREDLKELKKLLAVFGEVFEMRELIYPEDTYLRKLLEKDNFMAVTASIDDKVVGGLTVYVLDGYYNTRKTAYIHDLAVLGEYQRQGIGRQLINYTNKYCRALGFEESFVQAEIEDDYAIDFYRSTKPTLELPAMHFGYTLGNGK